MNRRSDQYLPGILNGVALNYALIMTLLVAGVSWLPYHRLLTRTMALAPEVNDGQPL